MGISVGRALESLGVQDDVINVALLVFPGDSFEPLIEVVRDAAATPPKTSRILGEVPPMIGVGLTSHTLIRMRQLLSLGPASFPQFTRDYVRRCCDIIEIALKQFALDRSIVSANDRRPLGALISLLEKKKELSTSLAKNLKAYNARIYVRAKHEVTRAVGSQMFNVSDAAVITIVAMKLGDWIDHQYRYEV